MENILEMLYDLQQCKTYGPDSPFVKAARIKNENLDLLTASMTDEQKEWLDAYFDADCKIAEIIDFDRFRFAFHLGAQLMAELLEGRSAALGG